MVGIFNYKKVKMELKVGLKFEKYYSENNVNNVPYCEVRGIVDDEIIVLLCKKNGKEYYKSIDMYWYLFSVNNGTFIPILDIN